MDLATDQLDRLIERRADKTPDPDTQEASYMESVRRYHARRHQAELWERLRFHNRQLANHRAVFREIIQRHKAGLAECEAALGIGDSGGSGAPARTPGDTWPCHAPTNSARVSSAREEIER